MYKVQIVGTGSYVPDKVVKNDDLSKIMDTDDKWIKSRTGISERRISEGENTSHMATKAALKAIEKADISADKLDFIIVATTTPDNFMPSTACMVQKNIGAFNATCFDISAACTGYIYVLDVATQFIRSGRAKSVLIIGAETFSKILDWNDRSTCVLFGDGASAAVLKRGEKDSILSLYTGSDGRLGDFLTCSAVPVNNPYANGKFEDVQGKVKMDGREVFKFAVKIMEKCISKLLKNCNCSMGEIKLIIPHQANSRIIDAASKRLNISSDKFFINLNKYGNTSAASIGIAFDEVMERHFIETGDKVILVGFGGGLTYGGVVVQI